MAPPTPLEWLDALSHLMDRRWVVPGTNVRFGVNSLVLFLPGLGDVAASAVSAAIPGLVLMFAIQLPPVARIAALR